MTVSVSTLLTGRCGRNCLYLNCLGNKPLAKRAFRKVVLADSCRDFNLAMLSSSVSYREYVRNRACLEGRNSAPIVICNVQIDVLSHHMSTPYVHACVPVAFTCGIALLWKACSATRNDHLTLSHAGH